MDLYTLNFMPRFIGYPWIRYLYIIMLMPMGILFIEEYILC